jgi:hypothetical protein
MERARRVGRSYRDALAERDPERCGYLDRRMTALGQRWVVPRRVTYEPDELLTVGAVAEMCDVQRGTVAQWRRRGLVVTATPDGTRYRVSDVLAYHARLRQRRVPVGEKG